MQVNGIDRLAITNLDGLDGQELVRICDTLREKPTFQLLDQDNQGQDLQSIYALLKGSTGEDFSRYLIDAFDVLHYVAG